MSNQRIEKKIADFKRVNVQYGKMASGKYGVNDLEEMLVYVLELLSAEEEISNEELTTLRRQLAAANARVAKLAKKENDAS